MANKILHYLCMPYTANCHMEPFFTNKFTGKIKFMAFRSFKWKNNAIYFVKYVSHKFRFVENFYHLYTTYEDIFPTEFYSKVLRYYINASTTNNSTELSIFTITKKVYVLQQGRINTIIRDKSRKKTKPHSQLLSDQSWIIDTSYWCLNCHSFSCTIHQTGSSLAWGIVDAYYWRVLYYDGTAV